ncbi:hypothetical protein DFH28DRAFT_944614 [Melampsora americana]|nr:hypothetical protein DFH28DRAFT_944614 [Melampsora americana]
MLCLTMSILTFHIFTVLTKPMHLDGNLDTTLRLATIASEIRTPPSADDVEPLELTLATSSSGTKVGSTTTKQFLHDALVINKNASFKPSSKDKKTSKLMKDGDLCIENTSLRVPQAKIYQPRTHYNIIPFGNLGVEIPGFVHHLQGPGSNAPCIHKVATQSTTSHNLGLKLNLAQRIKSHELYSNELKIHQFQPIPGPFFSHHPTPSTRVQERVGITGSNTQSAQFKVKAKASIVFNGHKILKPKSAQMRRFSRLGRYKLQSCDVMWKDICSWFDQLESKLITKLAQHKEIGIKSCDLKMAVSQAQHKLTTAFLGFMIENRQLTGITNDEAILSEGWDFMKSYMAIWENVDFSRVLPFLNINFYHCGQWDSPEHVLAYLLNSHPNSILSVKVLSKFISSWKQVEKK